MEAQLKPCPACGKRAGELKETTGARFPFTVQCRECGWSTDAVKVPGVAMKIWSAAKLQMGAKPKRKGPEDS